MRKEAPVVLLAAACMGLLAGCRTDYLVEPQFFTAAAEANRRGYGDSVAISAIPVPESPPPGFPAAAPRQYVRASALRLDLGQPGARYWSASTRNRRGHLTAGGVLLGLGLASLLGGGIAAEVIAKQPCHGRSEECGLGQAIGVLFFAVPAWVAGFGETVAGVTLLGLGARRTELGLGEQHVEYIPPFGAAGAPGALPATAPAGR